MLSSALVKEGGYLKTSGQYMYVAVLSALFSVTAFVMYNLKLLGGEVSPNAASWAVWAFVTVLNFTSYRAMTGDWVKSLLPTMNSLLCIATFVVLAFRGGFAQIPAYDQVALVLGILAGLIWWLTRSSRYAQVILSFAIAIGFVPTFVSVFKNAHAELFIAWLLWSMAFVSQTVLVVLRWREQKMDLLYPVWGFILHGAVAVLALR